MLVLLADFLNGCVAFGCDAVKDFVHIRLFELFSDKCSDGHGVDDGHVEFVGGLVEFKFRRVKRRLDGLFCDRPVDVLSVLPDIFAVGHGRDSSFLFVLSFGLILPNGQLNMLAPFFD